MDRLRGEAVEDKKDLWGKVLSHGVLKKEVSMTG